MIPKTYKHLDANERDILAVLKSKGRSLREISTILKRSPSTLSRELKAGKKSVYRHTDFIVPCITSPSKNGKAIFYFTDLFPVRIGNQ